MYASWYTVIQAAAARSNTVILAKNLPAQTTADEIEAVFGVHGGVERVLLPPGGVTAIIKFTEAAEAKKAFRTLAYTKVCE